MGKARCFVGIDSGPMQCAAASGTHIVALLTHLKPERILPYRNGKLGDNCTSIQANMPCVGCNDKQVRPVRQLNCEHGDFPCNRNWDTDAIANAILETLV
jgi:ADP-heptose:LPS heptosyltransferase